MPHSRACMYASSILPAELKLSLFSPFLTHNARYQTYVNIIIQIPKLLVSDIK